MKLWYIDANPNPRGGGGDKKEEMKHLRGALRVCGF